MANAIANESQGTFAQVLACASPEQRPICRALRALIISLDKSCTEIAWPKQRILSFGIGPKKMTQHYAYLAIHRAHINLGFYQGASLPDPAGLLEGNGKALRHIKVTDLAVTRSAAVATLLRAALAGRKAERKAERKSEQKAERKPYADCNPR